MAKIKAQRSSKSSARRILSAAAALGGKMSKQTVRLPIGGCELRENQIRGRWYRFDCL